MRPMPPSAAGPARSTPPTTRRSRTRPTPSCPTSANPRSRVLTSRWAKPASTRIVPRTSRTWTPAHARLDPGVRLQPVSYLALQEPGPLDQVGHEPAGGDAISRRHPGQPQQPEYGARPAGAEDEP